MSFYQKLSYSLEGTLFKKVVRFIIRRIQKNIGNTPFETTYLGASHIKNEFMDLFFSEKTQQFNKLEVSLNTKFPEKEIKQFVLKAKASNLGTIARKTLHSSSRNLYEKETLHNVNTIVTLTRSWGFINPLLDDLEKNHGVAVSRIDLAKCDNRQFGKNFNRLRYYRERGIVLAVSKKKREEVEQSRNSYFTHDELSLIDKADIVLIEWMNMNALTALPYITPEKRIIIRIHSHEIYTFYPILIDYGKIDGLIFISDGVRAMFEALWGWLIPTNIKIFVGENIRSQNKINILNKTDHIKTSSRNKVIGLLQYHIPVKDFNFALDVFEKLRKADPEYKLLLAGLPLSSNLTAENKALLERMKSYEDDAINELGYLKDVSSFFNSVGFILSTSKREGSHEAVVEGAAHGCIPIIRDWPVLSYVCGAKKAFPEFDILKTPNDMVKSILRKSPNFEKLSDDAREKSSSFYDKKLIVDYLKFFRKIATNEK